MVGRLKSISNKHVSAGGCKVLQWKLLLNVNCVEEAEVSEFWVTQTCCRFTCKLPVPQLDCLGTAAA